MDVPNESVKDEVYVSEEVECFSDTDFDGYSIVACPTPLELHEKYQEFLKANGSKNNSVEWHEESDCFSEDRRVINGSDNAGSNNDSDQSLQDVEVHELHKKNSSLRQRNKELYSKNEELLRQVETIEEESDKQRIKMVEMEKDHKTYQDMLRDSSEIRLELDQIQAELRATQANEVCLKQEVKRLKSDEEDAMITMNTMRDQIDQLTYELSGAAEVNNTIAHENQQLKTRCDSLLSDLQTKDNELEQKEQLYQEATAKAMDRVVSMKDLQEEKEALLNQLRDMQLEVSIYQNYHKSYDDFISPKPPQSPSCKAGNLLSELTAADQNGDSTSYWFNSKKPQNSPKPEHLHNFSPNKSALNGSISDLAAGVALNGSISDLAAGLALNGSISDLAAGVEVTEHNDATSQTETKFLVVNGSHTEADYIGKEELEMLLKVQEHCTVVQDELRVKRRESSALCNELVNKENEIRYFSTQLETSRGKVTKLLALCERKTVENLYLTELISKICSSRLDSWYDQHRPEIEGGAQGRTSVAEPLTDNDGQVTMTVDALSLEITLPLTARCTASVTSYNNKRLPKLIREMSVCFTNDQRTIPARLSVLRGCRDIILSAISQKVQQINDHLQEIMHCCQRHDVDRSVAVARQHLSNRIGEQLAAVENIAGRLSHFVEPISSLRCEEKCSDFFKMFLNHIHGMNEKIDGLELKLREPAPTNDCECQNMSCDVNELISGYDRMMGYLYPFKPSDRVKDFISNKYVLGILLFVFGNTRTMQNWIGKHRNSMLVLVFMLCTYLSITPVDRIHESVF